MINQQLLATKTTSVVFKQHDPQSVADLSGVAVALILGYTALFREKTTIFGAPWLKKGPHRRFGGSSVAEIFIFLISNKNYPLFVKIFFSISSLEKVIVLTNFLQKL